MFHRLFSKRNILLILFGFILGAATVTLLFKAMLFKATPTEQTETNTTVLENFIIRETKQEIKFLDREGNEILIIDKR